MSAIEPTTNGPTLIKSPGPAIELTTLGTLKVPRIFNGLWQLSSNAWGSASVSDIRDEMVNYVNEGFYAFADHYGPAEPLYGSLLETLTSTKTRVIGATKWCTFKQGGLVPTREMVQKAVKARNGRMKTCVVDLLQIHWQDLTSPSHTTYLKAFEYLLELQSQGLIQELGLCNFDTKRTEEICAFVNTCVERGIGVRGVVSNQVQFSLIDARPVHGMNEACAKYGVKLLTYGTLCGGFLSDKYLNTPEPDPYDASMTPSQRKYLDIILSAWGTWPLFQELLAVLRKIADRYTFPTSTNGEAEKADIANIAVRWVLDHPFVGAVLVGTRFGITSQSHLQSNKRVFAIPSLSEGDRKMIQDVLDKSNSSRMVEMIGDCGSEYRQF